MSRHSDRFMTGSEWDEFVSRVENGDEAEDLRTDYKLSKRNTIRSIRRAQKQLGIPYTIPPEDAHTRENGQNGKRQKRDDLPDLSPAQRAALANDWSYLSPIEKAHRLLPDRIGKNRMGDYTLDNRPVSYREVIIAANQILAAEGMEQLPGPNVYVDPPPGVAPVLPRLRR